MIHLDLNNPFVRATLTDSIEEAAAILKSAERRFGLRWSKSHEFLGESANDVWYQEHLWPFLSETHFVLSGSDMQVGTGCSLIGADGLDHTPTWRHWGGILADWANLHWVSRPSALGETEWARAARPWEYLDFYSHDSLSYLIADYDLWLERLNEVLSQTNGVNP